ncbi:centrosomal protein of 128 kDa-like [Saccoglossus kowalevskii]|uniref:Centrosomal protein of 128 kDa-like n=1 Tax=Saccoglossus kowalevskii TaxID=10224 RepID=A0ABM0GRH7_SACKO|nr:PREDICTED: centrosomal protein of 128 kDa-like [Saccoglossus kowalevskii]
MSSDSEGYDHRLPPRRASRRLPTPPSSPRSQGLSDSALTRDSVTALTTTLYDTNRNLREVDRMLGQYRDASDSQSSAINRLRENLARSSDKLKEERLKRSLLRDSRPLRSSDLDEDIPSRRYRPTSPLRDYGESGEYSRRRRRRKASVRFEGEPEEQLHDIHQSVRDISSDQVRLAEDLEREVERRTNLDYEHRRAISQLSDSMRQVGSRAADESVSNRVERRLKEIEDEIRLQRTLKQPPMDSIGMVPADLRQAMRSQSIEEDRQLRERMIKSEIEKQHLLSDYETTKRKLDQSEGSRNALKQKIEELEDQLSRSGHDRSELKDKLSEYASVLEEEGLPFSRQARRERKFHDERQKQEEQKQQLEREIHNLKSQLTKSSGIRELEEVKQDFVKSERQRAQLSDHMEALNQELTSKEKYQAKLINQLKDVTDKYNDTDQQKQLAMSQLEETQKRLRETNREADLLADKLRDTQRFLEDAERKKDEMKVKAQETVRQWKQRCKKLEKEVDRHKHSSQQLMSRNEQLARENETGKTHSFTNIHRLESLQRELNEALAIRAQQDEQLRIKDIELNETKSFKMDLDKELRDTRAFMDKLDNELQTQIARQAALKEEKMRVEEELITVKSSFQQAQDQLQNHRDEVRELSSEKTELSTRLAEESSRRQDVQCRLEESRQQESAAREEIAKLINDMKREQESHSHSVSDLRREVQEMKAREDQTIQEIARNMKREKAEMEAEIHTMKLSKADDKSTIKQLRRQAEKMKLELEKVCEDLAHSQDEFMRVKKKYERLKLGLEEKTQHAEEGDNRVAELERDLQQTHNELEQLQIEYENMLHSVGSEIDLLAWMSSKEKFQILSPPTKGIYTDTQKWLADKKMKLQWMQEEARQRQESEKSLKHELNRSRTDVHEAVSAGMKDRHYYESELQRQGEILDEVAMQKQVLEVNNKEKSEKVYALEDQIAELTRQIETRAKALERSLDSIPESDTSVLPEIHKDFKQLKELQLEREKINERYNKYKQTIGVLQQHLQDAKKSAEEQKQRRLDASLKATRLKSLSPSPSPTYKRRVHISNTPPTVMRSTPNLHMPSHSSPTSPRSRYQSQQLSPPKLDMSPMGWSFSKTRTTIHGDNISRDPLSLSDSEFRERFLPPMPSFSMEPEREIMA